MDEPTPITKLISLKQIEAKAREIYEKAREDVEGRPAWEDLDRSDPYDLGMIGHAYDRARAALKQAREA